MSQTTDNDADRRARAYLRLTGAERSILHEAASLREILLRHRSGGQSLGTIERAQIRIKVRRLVEMERALNSGFRIESEAGPAL